MLGFKAFPVSHVGNEKIITFQSIESAAFFKIGTNMSESFDWHGFLEFVEALCWQVEHMVQLSDSNTLQDFLFRLQAKRTACERLIGAAVASGVDTVEPCYFKVLREMEKSSK